MTRDNEDSLLRLVALQNAESIRAVRLRAEQQAEAALREQAKLLNLTHDAIFVRDMNGTVRYWNRGAEELYGWPAEQAVGRAIQELLKSAFQVPLEQIEREIIGAGRWEGELLQTKKDGSQVVVASRWSLQRDESGAPIAILVINNDITTRKRAEEVARRSERELRDVVNAVPAFAWRMLPDGAVDFVNDRWLEFTGLSTQDALGWNWEATVHPDDRSQAVAACKRRKVKCECGRRTENFAGGSSAMSQCTMRWETSRNGTEALLISTTASAQNLCWPRRSGSSRWWPKGIRSLKYLITYADSSRTEPRVPSRPSYCWTAIVCGMVALRAFQKPTLMQSMAL